MKIKKGYAKFMYKTKVTNIQDLHKWKVEIEVQNHIGDIPFSLIHVIGTDFKCWICTKHLKMKTKGE